jgi:hypothetical protein
MSDDLCTLIAACIADPDSATYEALNQYLASENATDIIRGKFPQLQKGLNPGLPPDDDVLTAPLGLDANPSCDLDVLWAQCLAIVVTVSQAMIDFMEQVEVATNAVELGNALISSVPLVSAIAETMGANGWLDLVNYFQEAFAEGFIAGYTETPGGSRDTLACAIFCLCRDDCIITIDRIFIATLQTFGESVPDTVLESLQAAAEYISGISLFSSESSYYATMFVAALMAKAGSAFLPALTQGTLNLIIALAADAPSNDWELLCDCAPETVDTFSWGIARWRIEGGEWNDVTYTQTANGIECGVVNLPIGVPLELEAIAGTGAMGIGWRSIWPNPPYPNVKVQDWVSATPYYFTSDFASGTPPNNTALVEAGDLGDTGAAFIFLGTV